MAAKRPENGAAELAAELLEEPDIFEMIRPRQRGLSQVQGVVIGRFEGIREDGTPLVDFPGNPARAAVAVRSMVRLTNADRGCEIVLAFEGGDPAQPVALGRVVTPAPIAAERETAEATIDGERIVLAAEKEILLRCGEASIQLTCEGKVYVRGANLLSRSSGPNRIKGGSVRIN